MDANKIKFVDDDGSVEILEPPMTSRVHKETPTEEKVIPETIKEEPSSEEESVIIVSSSTGLEAPVDSSVEDLKSSVEDLSGEILNLEEVKGVEAVKEPLIEDAVEQHVKGLEKMESVLSSSIEEPSPKTDEVKDEIDKEALSLVANAVNDIRAEERVPVTPKGCCILQ